MTRPLLIIFSGLPGVGKTTLAKEIARQTGATYLRIDSIERGLARSVLEIHPAEDAGYTVGYAVAEDNLLNGQTVVADSVNPIGLTRDAWRACSEAAGCIAVEVEVVCSDHEEHRRRIEQRRHRFPNLRTPTWQDVLDREYHPWKRDRMIIDTATTSITAAVGDLMKVYGSRRSGPETKT